MGAKNPTTGWFGCCLANGPHPHHTWRSKDSPPSKGEASMRYRSATGMQADDLLLDVGFVCRRLEMSAIEVWYDQEIQGNRNSRHENRHMLHHNHEPSTSLSIVEWLMNWVNCVVLRMSSSSNSIFKWSSWRGTSVNYQISFCMLHNIVQHCATLGM